MASLHITSITCILPFRFLPCFPTLTPILTNFSTATTLRGRRTTRRTNDGAGAHAAAHTAETTTLPPNVPPRGAPVAPNLSAAQRRTTDGQAAAWSGHRLVAVAHPGPTGSNPPPRPLFSTTIPASPVASTGRPPKRPNVLQGEEVYPSRYQGGFSSNVPYWPLVPYATGVFLPSSCSLFISFKQ